MPALAILPRCAGRTVSAVTHAITITGGYWIRRFGQYECAECGKQTSVTAGTVMHGSKLPLSTWFCAAYLMATHSNTIPALQLQKLLGLGSYKTAWLLCANLRRAMVGQNFDHGN